MLGRFKYGFRAIAFDFDGVIAPFAPNMLFTEDLTTIAPDPTMQELAIQLHNEGYMIWIHTTRCLFNNQYNEIIEWLRHHRFPFTFVTPIKLPAIIYIDDNALQYRSGVGEKYSSDMHRYLYGHILGTFIDHKYRIRNQWNRDI